MDEIALELTPEMSRDGRRLIRWQAVELAERAGVPLWAVERFEATGSPSTIAPALWRTFYENRLTFHPADGWPFLDGYPHNTRTDNGAVTRIDPARPVKESCFRHPPL